MKDLQNFFTGWIPFQMHVSNVRGSFLIIY